MTLDQLADRILDRIPERRPRALLIGAEPPIYLNVQYVLEEPYDAVILGILPPGELLHMPSDPICRAILERIPVYLWQNQPYRKAKHGKLLCRKLLEAEERLLRLGVQPIPGDRRLLTVENIRQLEEWGIQPNRSSCMTPMAKDCLEDER